MSNNIKDCDKLKLAGVRGLLYEPTNEIEVVILFSMLLPYLEDDFVIVEYPDTFPDCIALRNNERVGIEFEYLASHFFEHKHHMDENLEKCNLIVCWKNNIPYKTKRDDEREYLNVNGYEIEIFALEKIVKKLEEEKGLELIICGSRPDLLEANEKRFFEQLKETVSEKKYSLIKMLFDYAKKKDEFEIMWGRGKRWYTMRLYVKKWGVDPIGVMADGQVYIGYQGNPAISPWRLPMETQTKLRKLFKHKKQKWPGVPLDSELDLEKLKEAIEILAEDSHKLDLVWNNDLSD